MPTFRYDSQAEWNSWELSNLEATAEGLLQIVDGQASGSADSPVIHAPEFRAWSRVKAVGTRDEGCCMYLYWRSAATAELLALEEWQGPVDTWDDDGVLYFDLRTWFLQQETVSVGEYIQLRVVLEAE